MWMRLKIGFLAAFSMIAIFLCTSPDRTRAERSLTDASLEENGSTPKSLFVQNCARCHGVDGRGQTRLGRKLEASDLTSSDVKDRGTPRIIRTITNGRTGMPAFGKKLTRQEIASIADYVRSL